ncbi:MAG TPA: excinuclease ABC subunit UvrA, partial [Candidatus Pelethenecus sp.]|nr:excinuclease ABC subunit UvrA [Candidatus Pelethenecus sp.]
MDHIVVKGARENNLKNISIELPKNKFIVMTGLSGSGKSSLAFDTIYQEGQRRFVESLSSYARQFIGSMDKPDVDSIEGLSPAISIDQKSASHNPRSTVGTVTEIYDYLRVLFARIGTPYCPTHHVPISSFSNEQIVNKVLELPLGSKLYITSPVVFREKGEHKNVFSKYLQEGFVRAFVDGEIVELDHDISLEKNKKHT